MFVGGMIRGLLITDPGASPARPTADIDVVAAVGSQAEYYALAERLRALGFREDHREGAPLCRWIVEGLTVDVMPDRADVLGFSNRWYSSARATATRHEIGGPDGVIRVVDAPHFVATKLEAFRGRGESDFYHHDMEDVVAVVDGRAELETELGAAREEVRAFVARELHALMNDEFPRLVGRPPAGRQGEPGAVAAPRNQAPPPRSDLNLSRALEGQRVA